MNARNQSKAILDMIGELISLLGRKNHCDLATFAQNLADILVTVVLTDGIIRVINLAYSGFLQSFLDLGNDCFITLSVINNSITFASVDECLDEGLASPSDDNKRMDVRGTSKLDGIRSLCVH
jgi:hypothetical protein